MIDRCLRRYKSIRQAQRFVTAHAAVCNLFNIGRHMVSANHYRSLRISAFSEAGRSLESGWKIPAAWFS